VSVVIRGTGSYLPETRLTNEDLARIVETSDDWIVARTGIRERRMLASDEATSDMATHAGEAALAAAGIDAADLDLIMVACVTPDMLTPSTANLVHKNLCRGRAIPSFDMNAACSGFVYGLAVAKGMMESGDYRRTLLVGAEAMTRITDYEDRETCVLFGDAAGAVVLERSDVAGGILATTLCSDGQHSDLIQVPGCGSRRPASPEVLAERQQYLQMNGRAVFKLAVQSMEQIALDTLKKVGWTIDSLNAVLCHQANGRIVQATAERLGVSAEKLPMNIDRVGNTSSASIPVLLDECNRHGRFRAGDKLLLISFGAGLTWGAAAVEWA
jgi:3-oxoacyl-[acyl-carrier-protein] synthase-3